MTEYRSTYHSDDQPRHPDGGILPGESAERPLTVGSGFIRPYRLSERDSSVVTTVQRFRQASASQLTRLHFPDGSAASTGRRQRRTCARLVKWGAIQKLARPIGGGMGGSGETIYIPAGSRTRLPDPHTLDITETYVQLVEAARDGLAYLLEIDPEPYCHVQLGHLELKPDLYVRLKTPEGTFRYWLEMDRGTEFRPHLRAKMRRYTQAFHSWPEETFPQVLWIVQDDVRLRLIEGVIKRQETPGLFAVVQIRDVINRLVKG